MLHGALILQKYREIKNVTIPKCLSIDTFKNDRKYRRRISWCVQSMIPAPPYGRLCFFSPHRVLTECDPSERQWHQFDCFVFYWYVLTGRERRSAAQCFDLNFFYLLPGTRIGSTVGRCHGRGTVSSLISSAQLIGQRASDVMRQSDARIQSGHV